MKWRENVRREYYAKYERVKLVNDQGWFECYKLPGNVWAIATPQHLQEVNCFLICGKERALLLDTGMGICDIYPVVRELWAGPLQVVNNHLHFDHTGGNWRFPEVFVANDPLALAQAAHGVPHVVLANQAHPDMFLADYPQGFNPETYCVHPYAARPLPNGHVFHLGGRDVEFVRTPGHTADSAMLYDHAHDILFAGDMAYFGAIYVQFASDIMGHSNINDYIASLDMLAQRFPDVQAVFASHNDFVVSPTCLPLIRNALVAVRDGASQGSPLHDEKWGYYDDPPALFQHFFDGFSVIAAQ